MLAVTCGSDRIADCRGVTGAAEGSRYYGTGHPRHSYLGRVCKSLQQGEGGEATARTALLQRRPGEAVYPNLELSTTQVMHLVGHISKPLRVMLKQPYRWVA